MLLIQIHIPLSKNIKQCSKKKLQKRNRQASLQYKAQFFQWRAKETDWTYRLTGRCTILMVLTRRRDRDLFYRRGRRCQWLGSANTRRRPFRCPGGTKRFRQGENTKKKADGCSSTRHHSRVLVQNKCVCLCVCWNVACEHLGTAHRFAGSKNHPWIQLSSHAWNLACFNPKIPIHQIFPTAVSPGTWWESGGQSLGRINLNKYRSADDKSPNTYDPAPCARLITTNDHLRYRK